MNRDEVLWNLLKRVVALEKRVGELESTDHPWDEPFPMPTLSESSQEDSQEGKAEDELSPEEQAAVEAARARLANETGGTPEQPDPGTRVEADGKVVDLPPVDQERAVKRHNLARTLNLEADGIDPNAYVKGGPLWLYYGNREYVMGLPEAVHRQMIEDVQQDSVQEAQEMARDLLMFRGKEGPSLG